MNREMLQQLLTTAKPGWRIKIDPNLSVATGNTHPRMVKFKGIVQSSSPRMRWK